MSKPLKRIKSEIYYFADGKKLDGVHSRLSGNCSGLSGDCSLLSGDCSGLSGDCSDLYGDCSKIPIDEREAKPELFKWIEE